MNEPAMWNLERRGGTLFWDGCNLSDLARNHGTPLYVVNTSLLERNHRDLLGAFQAEGLAARIFFSYKTNPVPAVLACLTSLGCGAEVISEFEYWLATRLGIPGRDVIVNGTDKSDELLRLAVRDGAGIINVESTDEILRLGKIAADLGSDVNVGLRFNPCLPASRLDFSLAAGSRRSHIGFIPRGSDWHAALEILGGDRRLRLRGLHFHIGSGVRSVRPYRKALRIALQLHADLVGKGFRPEVLDIGGGFGTSTLREFNLLEAVRLFGWGRPPRQSGAGVQASLLQEVAGACSSALREWTRSYRIDAPAIHVEPGRALVSSAQLLLLRVVSLKRRKRGPDAAVCDAGAMSLSPQLLSECHTVFVANKGPGTPTARYDLIGNLPAPLDWIGLNQQLPLLEAGDILAVMDTGAYFSSLGNNFAGPRPAILVLEKGAPRRARRREWFEDMVERDFCLASGQAAPGRLRNEPA